MAPGQRPLVRRTKASGARGAKSQGPKAPGLRTQGLRSPRPRAHRPIGPGARGPRHIGPRTLGPKPMSPRAHSPQADKRAGQTGRDPWGEKMCAAKQSTKVCAHQLTVNLPGLIREEKLLCEQLQATTEPFAQSCCPTLANSAQLPGPSLVAHPFAQPWQQTLSIACIVS